MKVGEGDTGGNPSKFECLKFEEFERIEV